MKSSLLFSKFIRFTLVVVICMSCGEDSAPEEMEDDREGINILQLNFETPNEEPIVLRFEDLDGAGGNDPIIQSPALLPLTQYFVTAEVFRGTTDLTTEISEESSIHQYFYAANIVDLVVTYGDRDGNGFPLGAFVAIRTGDVGQGSLAVSLMHRTDKDGEGVSEGNLFNAGGKTDIQVTFPIVIE